MTNVVTALLLLSVLMGIGGCRRQVPVGPASQPTTRPSADSSTTTRTATGASMADSSKKALSFAEARQANVAEVAFTYLTTRSKLAFKSPQQEIDNASLSIRVYKDSLVWLSVSKLGIEAVRVLISRDSVRILDKLNRQYAVADFPTLSRQYNVPLSFPLLQALIVGNLPLPGRPAQVMPDQSGYLLLRQTDGNVQLDNSIDQQDHKLKKMLITEQPTRNTLQLDYSDFAALNTFLFPYTSQLTIDYQSKTNDQRSQTVVTIRHNKVELTGENPGFPFAVPASYQRRP